MEKKVFRVGSVGIGGISRGVHLPGIHKSPDLELVAVCDLKPERMEYARNTYGIREDHCMAGSFGPGNAHHRGRVVRSAEGL